MEERKNEHIGLALSSQMDKTKLDDRFVYEPLLSAHPDIKSLEINFLDKKLGAPIWISSMTGGSQQAENINRNLARACNEFGLGMGLGSCRIILNDDKYFSHFNVRHIIGDNFPFYANLGIAQVEQLLKNKKVSLVLKLIDRLKADGLIIHINPVQEWLQPEGDKIERPPIETIEEFMSIFKGNLIIKEVGQGIGSASLRALLKLPLAAIEFGAFGGTNFAKTELLRSADNTKADILEPLSRVGNTADFMLDSINAIVQETEIRCKQLIISGGIKNFIDGYYGISKSKLPAIYGQASGFLKHAQDDYKTLQNYVSLQLKGLALAKAYLKIR